MNVVHLPGQGASAPGRAVSSVAIGTISFCQQTREAAFEVLDEFHRRGGGIVDTAINYQNGESEAVLGMWMAERNAREGIIVLDKGNAPRTTWTRQGIREAIGMALERLGVEYIDLWVFHLDHPAEPVSLVVESLNEEIGAGRVRGYGVSNWSVERIEAAMSYAAGRGLHPPSVSSVHVTLAVPVSPVWGHRAATEDDLRWYAQVGMPVISWAPLAHGFFSDEPKPFGDSEENVRRWYDSEANRERRRRARMLAGERGVTLAQIALAYVWNLPGQIIAIVGALNAEQVASAYAAAQIELSQQEMDWLNLKCESR